MKFSDQLLNWYDKNRRDLPWRQTRDPYKIWLSEIILQQTRVEQGMPYYYRFLEAFPTLKKLASATEDEVLMLWQGLGYYSRGRNLLTAARQMVTQFKGFPSTYEEILSLKGIGTYTAAAVASIAFDLPYAVVDGNVYRFLSRFYGIETPIDGTEGKKMFLEIADSLLDKKNPGHFNQAMMEMGALVCKPKPECHRCIFAHDCFAFKNNTISQLPVKSKKASVKARYFYYLIIHYKDKVFIRQREKGDIWQGLFEFPLVECDKPSALKKLIQTKKWQKIFEKQAYVIIKNSEVIKHPLTHQTLNTVFIHVKIDNVYSEFLKTFCKRIAVNQLSDFAMPRLLNRYINHHDSGLKVNINITKTKTAAYFVNFALGSI